MGLSHLAKSLKLPSACLSAAGAGLPAETFRVKQALDALSADCTAQCTAQPQIESLES